MYKSGLLPVFKNYGCKGKCVPFKTSECRPTSWFPCNGLGTSSCFGVSGPSSHSSPSHRRSAFIDSWEAGGDKRQKGLRSRVCSEKAPAGVRNVAVIFFLLAVVSRIYDKPWGGELIGVLAGKDKIREVQNKQKEHPKRTSSPPRLWYTSLARVDRAKSVSSMRRMNVPPVFFAGGRHSHVRIQTRMKPTVCRFFWPKMFAHSGARSSVRAMPGRVHGLLSQPPKKQWRHQHYETKHGP